MDPCVGRSYGVMSTLLDDSSVAPWVSVHEEISLRRRVSIDLFRLREADEGGISGFWESRTGMGLISPRAGCGLNNSEQMIGLTACSSLCLSSAVD